MSLLSSSVAASQRKFFILMAAAGVAGAIAVYWWSGTPTDVQPPAETHVEKNGPVRFGPGEWTGNSGSSTDRAGGAIGSPPPGLAVDSAQKLQIGTGLHAVFDYFLIDGTSSDLSTRADELRAYMKAQLPAAAYDTAEGILRQYLAYMVEHDKLLASQGFAKIAQGSPISPQELARAVNWQQQRERLRQSMLGAQVAQLWYQDDDLQLRRALAELQGMAAQQGFAEDSNSIRERRMHGEQQDRLREQANRDTVAQAEKSFAVLRGEADTWREHYAAYRRELDVLMQRNDVDAAERERRIIELRNKNFPNESERARAVSLGI
jgi:lipase chaperone LimK